MRVTETTVFEGEPHEIDAFMNGPSPQHQAQDIAIRDLLKRTDELAKAMEVLLNAKKGNNKTR